MRKPWMGLLVGCVLLGGAAWGDDAPIANVQPIPASEGRLIYSISAVLDGPAEGTWIVNSAAVLAWNGSGRVFWCNNLNAPDFRRLAATDRLTPGQSVLITQRYTFHTSEDPARLAFVVNLSGADGKPVRIVRWYALKPGATPLTDPPLGQARFEVRVSPDKPEAIELPRSKRRVYSFDLWLQETNGAAVTVTQCEWIARNGAGEVVADRRQDISGTGGAALVVGPDATLSLAGQKLVLDPGKDATELALVVSGRTAAGAPATAMSRVALGGLNQTAGQILVRLPVAGGWHVAAGPGDPPNVGAMAHGWVFDMLDRAGHAWAGDGSKPTQHFAYGRPVVAPAAGTVSAAAANNADADRPTGSGGFMTVPDNYVLIDHGNGERSYIGGLQKGTFKVVVGMRIAAGDPVGTVGCTGPFGRPAVTYRLLYGSEGLLQPISRAPRFSSFLVMLDNKWQPGAGWPETGDLVMQQ